MRIIIADDHPTVRAGVRLMLERRSDFIVVAEADSPDGLAAALRNHPADLVLTDFSMPAGEGSDGLELIRRIRREHAHLPVLVLTMLGNAGIHRSILELGAQGIIDKTAAMNDITRAIDEVASGKVFVSESFRAAMPDLGGRADQQDSSAPSLSPKETEVIRLFASGLSVSAIAARLSRSVKTVSRQKSDAMVKLGLKSDVQIYVFAREHGLAS